MKEQKYLKRSILIEKITYLFDFIAMAVYVGLFINIFSKIETPTKAEIIEGTVNYNGLTLSLLAILLFITAPLFFKDLKALRERTEFDYHGWYAGNAFIRGLISLITLNPISAGLRFFNTHVILKYVNGHSYVYGIKEIVSNIKNFFKEAKERRERKNEISNLDPNDPQAIEELRLRKQLRKQTITKILASILLYGFITVMALFIFIPFYWMMLTSLKTYQQTQSLTPALIIPLKDWQWVNYKYVLDELKFGLFIKNTLIVGVISTVGTVITTVFAAFAFSRIDFKGRETIFSLLLMTMMIPGELYIITNFITVSNLGWISTDKIFLALIIPFMTSVFYIFFLRQTFRQIPNSLYQAAKVDGCSDFKFLTRVMVPIAGSTIFTITILSVIGSWNAFIWPRLMTSLLPVDGDKYYLISVALNKANFMDDGGTRIMYNLQIASSALVTVPLIIVFLLLKKYIVRGVGRSGTKG